MRIPTGIPCVILLVLPKSSSVKTAAHPTARFFALVFCADDESLLTQAEEDKEKDKQKDCCGAVRVRLPAAYGRIRRGAVLSLAEPKDIA